jgi:hydroxyethylthiazole kinase
MDLLPHIAETLLQVRAKKPLVHHLTNYVTANDSANITLAIGASPVMTSDIGEVADMVVHAAAVVLNIGTLTAATVDAMVVAGQKAVALGRPVLLDPVGAGATPARTAAAVRIIREVKPAIIRGNMSEIKTLAGHAVAIRGVDSLADTAGGEAVAQTLAAQLGCVVAVTGATDIVAAAGRLCRIDNGHPMLASVTGTGCMASSLIGCCAGVAADPFLATVTGLVSMGVAGELAHESLRPGEGTGTFRMRLIDAVSTLQPEVVLRKAKLSYPQGEDKSGNP